MVEILLLPTFGVRDHDGVEGNPMQRPQTALGQRCEAIKLCQTRSHPTNDRGCPLAVVKDCQFTKNARPLHEANETLVLADLDTTF